MSSPWAKIATPEPVNFENILSEQIAKEIQSKKDQKFAETVFKELEKKEGNCSPDRPLILCSDESVRCKSDEKIAKMLQEQCNLKFDIRRAQEEQDSEEDDFLEGPREEKDWERFDHVEKQFHINSPSGYRVTEDEIITPTMHDMAMKATQNICEILNSLCYSKNCDGVSITCRYDIPDFSKLRYWSPLLEEKKIYLEAKEKAEFRIDQFARIILFKLINKRILKNINSFISIGKTALMLHAESDSSSVAAMPREYAIKVYKTASPAFERMHQYIGSYHYKGEIDRFTVRRTMDVWAEKEMQHLNKMKSAGIPCPEVIYRKHHVLVMSFIGENGKAAPKLKDSNLDEFEYENAYRQVIENMNLLYQKAKLIHADLLEHNILWHKGKCYIIDVGQSIGPTHMGAFGFLKRDCINVCKYFKSKGVPDVIEPDKLFFEITGCEFSDRLALEALESKFKTEPHSVNPGDAASPFQVTDKLPKNMMKPEMSRRKLKKLKVRKPAPPIVRYVRKCRPIDDR